MIVGPEELKFGIHKDQLCAISAYFKAALEGGFQETVRGEVVLKETTALAFGMFNEWLYTGTIKQELCMESGSMTLQKLGKDKPTFSELLDVWVLADYLLAPKLQNFIVDMMEAKHMKRAIPPLHEFGYFYIHTQSGSPMRRFLVDMCIWRFRGENGEPYRKFIDYMPRDMAVDLMVALARRVEGLERGPSFVAKNYYVKINA